MLGSLVLGAFVLYRCTNLRQKCNSDAGFGDWLYGPTCWDTSSWTKTIVVFFLKIMGCGFGDPSWMYLRKVQ